MITITIADGIPTKAVINILLVQDNVPDDEGWVGTELVEEDELIGRVEDILKTEGVNDIIALEWGEEVVDIKRDIELEWGNGVVVLRDEEPEWGGERVVDVEGGIAWEFEWGDGVIVLRDEELERGGERVVDVEGGIALDRGDKIVDMLSGEPVGNIVLELVDDSKVDSDVFGVLVLNDDIAVEDSNVLLAINSNSGP